LSPDAGRFLRLGEGVPTYNLLCLAQEELRKVLRTALHHAFDDGTATTRCVQMNVAGGLQPVTVRVTPSLEHDNAEGKFALIVFQTDELKSAQAVTRAETETRPPARHEAELEEELHRTQDLLESTNAAHDRAVAELQTVNEELRSINEEQKAATEELETSREEIQSINEELTTINQEHQSTIEELKRTNADLQNLIESTEIGTIFLDRAMRIRRFTPAVNALFNFVPADQGRSISHITHRLKYDQLEADVHGVLDSLERIEREVESDTGDSYIVRINPYRSYDGANEGAVMTFFDNTGQHRAQHELKVAKVAAESANLAKSTFLSTLSHEFRSPLTGILGYADLLQLDPLNASQQQKVERIKSACWHLTAMIEEILSFAKLEGGIRMVQSELLDAREIAREAKAMIEPAATSKGLAFELELPDMPATFVTDRAKARQILINLCGNAVKYTEHGEVRLSLSIEPHRMSFEVRDTGIGIASENHSLIFERFWQVDGALTRTAAGLGIGLAAAREYARLLGGDVEVDSALGEGSRFRLWLPTAP
jgi:two-component system, chemotaxis family, CheB/CheR fusion protein